MCSAVASTVFWRGVGARAPPHLVSRPGGMGCRTRGGASTPHRPLGPTTIDGAGINIARYSARQLDAAASRAPVPGCASSVLILEAGVRAVAGSDDNSVLPHARSVIDPIADGNASKGPVASVVCRTARSFQAFCAVFILPT